MGYYTEYSLKVQGDMVPACDHSPAEEFAFCPQCGKPNELVDPTDAIIAWAKENTVDGYNIGELLEDECAWEPCKWYEHENAMRAISKKFPTVLFVLSGIGEEQGDQWTKYFQGGKMQICKAEFSIPPYDPNKME